MSYGDMYYGEHLAGKANEFLGEERGCYFEEESW